MKYLVRSVKYFLYLAIILVIVLSALVLLKFVDGDINTMFRNGYDSLWQIAAMLAVFAALYPKFGFTSRKAIIPGSYSEIRQATIDIMESRGYRLEKENGEDMSFRRKSLIARLTKMTEDRVRLTRTVSGFDLEGLTKDVVRLVPALERIPDQKLQ